MSLKGVWHEIFDFRFFSWISFLRVPEYPFGAISNLKKNCVAIHNFVFIAIVADTGDNSLTEHFICFITLDPIQLY
jgi:hypothetical protein